VLIHTPDYLKTGQYETYQNLFIKIIQHYDSLSQREEILLQSLILELIYTIAKDCEIQNPKGRAGEIIR